MSACRTPPSYVRPLPGLAKQSTPPRHMPESLSIINRRRKISLDCCSSATANASRDLQLTIITLSPLPLSHATLSGLCSATEFLSVNRNTFDPFPPVTVPSAAGICSTRSFPVVTVRTPPQGGGR